MSRSVRWQTRARDEARALGRTDPRAAQRIVAAVDRFATLGIGDVKKLQGQTDEWRLRVGDWRVRFRISLEDGALVVLRVLPRGRAYRD